MMKRKRKIKRMNKDSSEQQHSFVPFCMYVCMYIRIKRDFLASTTCNFLMGLYFYCRNSCIEGRINSIQTKKKKKKILILALDQERSSMAFIKLGYVLTTTCWIY